jgi:hypothetical protein
VQNKPITKVKKAKHDEYENEGSEQKVWYDD